MHNNQTSEIMTKAAFDKIRDGLAEALDHSRMAPNPDDAHALIIRRDPFVEMLGVAVLAAALMPMRPQRYERHPQQPKRKSAPTPAQIARKKCQRAARHARKIMRNAS